jgi:hypothetical protein
MIVQTGLGVQGEPGGTAMSECQLTTIATFCWGFARCQLRAVKRTPSSQLYVGDGPDSGPSPGADSRPAFRPLRTIRTL